MTAPRRSLASVYVASVLLAACSAQVTSVPDGMQRHDHHDGAGGWRWSGAADPAARRAEPAAGRLPPPPPFIVG